MAARSKKLKELIKEEIEKVLFCESKYPETAAEYAEQLNQEAEGRRTSPDDWIGTLATDPEHWAKQGIHTGEELAHTLARETYSDVYKEKYGMRPRGQNLKAASVEEIEAMIDDLERYRDPWDDEPPAGPPMEPGEAEEWNQWLDKQTKEE